MFYILTFTVSLLCFPEIFLFFKDFIYLFLERGEGREKVTERNINVWLPLVCPLLGTWAATQVCALTGNRTQGPLVCRPALNPLSYMSQGFLRYFYSFVFAGSQKQYSPLFF